MKSFLVLALVSVFCLVTPIRSEDCDKPYVCKCDLMSSTVKNDEEAEVAMNLDPKITLEEFETRIPGRRNRAKNKKLLEFCTDACLDSLRARLQQKNVRDLDEKAIPSTMITAQGWDTLCDLLFNPDDEITDEPTLVAGTGDVTHYWLYAYKRDCDRINQITYLGESSCKCFDFDQLSFQKCYSVEGLGTYATGGYNLVEVV